MFSRPCDILVRNIGSHSWRICAYLIAKSIFLAYWKHWKHSFRNRNISEFLSKHLCFPTSNSSPATMSPEAGKLGNIIGNIIVSAAMFPSLQGPKTSLQYVNQEKSVSHIQTTGKFCKNPRMEVHVEKTQFPILNAHLRSCTHLINGIFPIMIFLLRMHTINILKNHFFHVKKKNNGI